MPLSGFGASGAIAPMVSAGRIAPVYGSSPMRLPPDVVGWISLTTWEKLKLDGTKAASWYTGPCHGVPQPQRSPRSRVSLRETFQVSCKYHSIVVLYSYIA